MAHPNSDTRGNTVTLYLSFAKMATPPWSARGLSARDIVVSSSSIKTTFGTFESNYVFVKEGHRRFKRRTLELKLSAFQDQAILEYCNKWKCESLIILT